MLFFALGCSSDSPAPISIVGTWKTLSICLSDKANQNNPYCDKPYEVNRVDLIEYRSDGNFIRTSHEAKAPVFKVYGTYSTLNANKEFKIIYSGGYTDSCKLIKLDNANLVFEVNFPSQSYKTTFTCTRQ